MKKHIGYFDILRIIASVFVVFMHVAADGLRTETTEHLGWYILASASSLAFCAVPLFFMMSGYLLTSSNRTSEPETLIKKRLPRLVVPLAFWSFIYILVKKGIDRDLSFKTVFAGILYGIQRPVNVSYWFMYALIGLYLISPILCPALKRLSKTGDRLVIGIIIILQLRAIIRILFPAFASNYMEFSVLYYLTIFDGHLCSFVLGWYLGKSNRKFNKGALLVGIIVLWGIISYGTIAISKSYGQYTQTFQAQDSGFEIILASLIFLFVKELNFEPKGRIGKLMSTMAEYSYPVYMMHCIFLLTLLMFFVPLSASSVLLVTLVMYGLCVLVAFIFSKIPVLRFLSLGKNINK